MQCVRVTVYHNPSSFHHSDPSPNQMAKFSSEIRNPNFHHVGWLTYPAPKKTGAQPVP